MIRNARGIQIRQKRQKTTIQKYIYFIMICSYESSVLNLMIGVLSVLVIVKSANAINRILSVDI